MKNYFDIEEYVTNFIKIYKYLLFKYFEKLNISVKKIIKSYFLIISINIIY